MRSNKSRPENIQFLLVGVMLILGGGQNTNFPVIGIFLIIIGGLLLLYSFYKLITGKSDPLLKLMAMCGELFGLLTAAYILYNDGTNYLHLLYLLASFGIMAAIVVHYHKNLRRKKLVK